MRGVLSVRVSAVPDFARAVFTRGRPRPTRVHRGLLRLRLRKAPRQVSVAYDRPRGSDDTTVRVVVRTAPIKRPRAREISRYRAVACRDNCESSERASNGCCRCELPSCNFYWIPHPGAGLVLLRCPRPLRLPGAASAATYDGALVRGPGADDAWVGETNDAGAPSSRRAVRPIGRSQGSTDLRLRTRLNSGGARSRRVRAMALSSLLPGLTFSRCGYGDTRRSAENGSFNESRAELRFQWRLLDRSREASRAPWADSGAIETSGRDSRAERFSVGFVCAARRAPARTGGDASSSIDRHLPLHRHDRRPHTTHGVRCVGVAVLRRLPPRQRNRDARVCGRRVWHQGRPGPC